MEFQSVFDGDIRLETAFDITIAAVELRHVGQGGFRLVVNVFDETVGDVKQRVGNHVACVVHARRMGLHNGCAVVDVDHQSRQEVAFAVNETECVVVGANES